MRFGVTRDGARGRRRREGEGKLFFFLSEFATCDRFCSFVWIESKMATRAHLGVTPPISVLPPTSRDLEVSRTLIAELEARCVYENVEEGRNREIVLGRLNTLVKQFVYRSALAHGIPDAKAREASVAALRSPPFD